MSTFVTIRALNEKSNYFLGNAGEWTIHSGQKAQLCEWVNGKSGFSGRRCATLISKIIAYVASFFGAGKILRFCFDPSISKDTLTFWVTRDTLKQDPHMAASEQDFGNPDFYPDSLTALKVHTRNWLHMCATVYIAPNHQNEDANNVDTVSTAPLPTVPSLPPQTTYTGELGTTAWMEEFKAKTEQWKEFLTHRCHSPSMTYTPPLVYQGF